MCQLLYCCFAFPHSTGKPLAPGEAHEKLFCTVTDKAHITACISAAQAVLLNPTVVGDAVADGAERFVPLLSAAEPGGRAPEASSAMRGLGDAAGYELQFTANKVRACVRCWCLPACIRVSCRLACTPGLLVCLPPASSLRRTRERTGAPMHPTALAPSHPQVVLEIVGAEADLTIIDLPGIIHSHPKVHRQGHVCRRRVCAQATGAMNGHDGWSPALKQTAPLRTT